MRSSSTAPSSTVDRVVSAVLLGALAFYRLAITPWMPPRCRFAPSCSAYAAEAIARHGPWKGTRLAAARVARCHPWHAGGHDPVPPAEDGARTPPAGTSVTSASADRSVRRSF